jgi:hypothetical protein
MRIPAYLAAGLGAIAAACQAPEPAPAPLTDYRLVDLTSTFSRIYDDTATLPDDQRLAALKAELTPRFPQFYRARDQADPASLAEYDTRLLAALNAFPELRTRYEAVARGFPAMIDSALATFRETLPGLRPLGDIHLLHSISEMDGGTRSGVGVTYFIFGADVIARIHAPGSEQPFFHHELFHIYHGQTFTDCEPIWCNVWMEGLAVLAAQELNPGATDAQLLLSLPQPIRAAVDANFVEAVCAVRAKLDSESMDDYRPLFNFRPLNERLPPRFGYYVGLRVAAEARKSMSLAELARLNPARARPVVDAAFDRLATCPA